MSNGRYIQEFQHFFSEITEPFQNEEGDSVFYKTYCNCSTEELLECCSKNKNLICLFLEKTPKSREKLRKKYSDEEWLTLSVGAYVALSLAVKLLERLDYHYMDLSGSYRDCAASVARDAIDIAYAFSHFREAD